MLNCIETFKPYCYEWESMARDETCPEFEACQCFTSKVEKEDNYVGRHSNSFGCRRVRKLPSRCPVCWISPELNT
jgi:hypothetical protein